VSEEDSDLSKKDCDLSVEYSVMLVEENIYQKRIVTCLSSKVICL